jgi:3-hydroxy acid dehydrogenase/malonic semialdehyde reductase
MQAMKDKLVLVTGASSGIGAACAHKFAAEGARLILNGRRYDRLEELASLLRKEFEANCLLLPFDVRDLNNVKAGLENLPEEWQAIDVLINNAGLARGLDKLQEGNIEEWEEMIDTNLKGLLYVTRFVIPGMIERGRGHIVNIASTGGIYSYPGGNVYSATKAAVRILSENLRVDLLGTPIRVSTISPGLVETEFSQVRFHGDKERAAKAYRGLTPLSAEDIAEVVSFCVTRPSHVNINEVILMPTDQATSTLVHRRE